MGARLRQRKTGPHNAKSKVICKEKREGHAPPFSTILSDNIRMILQQKAK
jgi:hypothetical protein